MHSKSCYKCNIEYYTCDKTYDFSTFINGMQDNKPHGTSLKILYI